MAGRSTRRRYIICELRCKFSPPCWLIELRLLDPRLSRAASVGREQTIFLGLRQTLLAATHKNSVKTCCGQEQDAGSSNTFGSLDATNEHIDVQGKSWNLRFAMRRSLSYLNSNV